MMLAGPHEVQRQINIIARAAINHAVDENGGPVDRDDWPGIGDSDWADVCEEIDRLAASPPLHEFNAAYAVLKARAQRLATAVPADRGRVSWTQPICESCFRVRQPGRGPVSVVETDQEVCVDCGEPTRAGIFYRVDPATAKHPTRLKD